MAPPTIESERTPTDTVATESPHPDNVLRALRELSVAMDDLIDTLTADRQGTRSVIVEIEQGDAIVDVARRRNMAQVRERLTNALDVFDRARADARTQIFRSLQHEGHSIGEVARLWGISRQLASRFVRENAETQAQTT